MLYVTIKMKIREEYTAGKERTFVTVRYWNFPGELRKIMLNCYRHG